MTQATTFNLPVVGPLSAAAFAAAANDTLQALLTQNKGTTRPSYAEAGSLWIDVVSGTEWNVYFWDGAHDVLVYTINPTAGTCTIALTGYPLLAAANTFTKAQSVTPVALTSTSNSMAVDASLSNEFTATLNESTTVANPTNLVPGTPFSIMFTQGTGGSKTIAWGSYFDFFGGGVAPTASTGEGIKDRFVGVVTTTTSIQGVLLKDAQ